jgi:hypothetical protein
MRASITKQQLSLGSNQNVKKHVSSGLYRWRYRYFRRRYDLVRLHAVKPGHGRTQRAQQPENRVQLGFTHIEEG